jgi:hypothetical protein
MPPPCPQWFQKCQPQRKNESTDNKSRLMRLPLRALCGFKNVNHKEKNKSIDINLVL